ncbi:G-type lectin S-receptor-like serine/threonine-protein kinase SD2-5 [Coffea arabica]|uniref:Receptor-like serine/threonine-protein kinase n=1 Tax=Coffea arabica TaxID=13443 RepID=A0A6P6U0G6_COFAR|nr:G-type lectin S-receptor-like serine/threonine-protein kinase SD2-5 [Coffea arabica]
MGNWKFPSIKVVFFLSSLLQTCMSSVQNRGRLNLGFQGAQMNWIDNDGLILLSNNSVFAFGFNPTQDVTLFQLVVVRNGGSTIIWSANRGNLIHNSDLLIFDRSGNAYLQSGGSTIWSTGTANKGVVAMELLDSGNLVLVGNDSSVIWQSFSHPTDTLMSNQEFTEGMKLVSNPSSNNLSFSLEIKSGDVILSADYQPPQPYWAMGKDNRRIINQDGGYVVSATLEANSWRFYGQNRALLWQFLFSDNRDANATWVAVLGSDGLIIFSRLQSDNTISASSVQIPQDQCSRPAACDPYFVCYSGNKCQCPSTLPSCKLGSVSFCNRSQDSVELVNAGDGLSYFALGFVPPSQKTDLNGCKASCQGNCSCAAMFHDSNSGNCFLFDQIGSLQGSTNGRNYASYIKVLTSAGGGANQGGGGTNKARFVIVIVIVISTVLVIVGLLYAGYRYHQKKNKAFPESPKESSEENFFKNLSGMPVRFSYNDLQAATNNFSVKLGQGGFGSVYQGILPDGTRLAVKKLESIGQGKKEFRAEVSIIGSIHHLHLVRLKGFCAEGSHRLLVYEYMANGSLDRWLFPKNKGEFMLDWETRYSIALGTAKGLAYLHEDCDVKIVHCDIKPENVLLDDHFLAKVSDFGLAKLMTREQSHVFTTLRGTRGYLAPEWITNYAISEKSDVYSYGMVLLEIIGGRKNYDPSQSSEKSHFPTYAFKMMEDGNLKDIIDTSLKIDEDDERVSTAIKVALWCIQDEMSLRPSMTKVVQMLEGICPVPPPPSSQLGSRLYAGFLKSISDGGTGTGTSSGPSDCNSDAYLSAIRLSGPR